MLHSPRMMGNAGFTSQLTNRYMKVMDTNRIKIICQNRFLKWATKDDSYLVPQHTEALTFMTLSFLSCAMGYSSLFDRAAWRIKITSR